jgi:single-strand DNA-binding protein
MNKVYLIGNLTRDVELAQTPSGVEVARFSIAVSRQYQDSNGERQTDFFNCVAWRGLAETIAKYCKKGSKVAVCGSIQLRNYEDNQGIKRQAVDIIVQDCEFLTPKQEELTENRKTSTKSKPTLTPVEIDEDIPF